MGRTKGAADLYFNNSRDDLLRTYHPAKESSQPRAAIVAVAF
jgi:hypothetical protein